MTYTDIAADYDRELLAKARALVSASGADEIRAYYEARGHPLHPKDNAHAAKSGTLSAVTAELLIMIDRQQAEIEHLTDLLSEAEDLG